MSLESVHHLTLPVHDLDVAERFWVGLLGATLVRRIDRAAFAQWRPERLAELDADNSPFHLAVRLGDSPEIHLFLQKGRARMTPPAHPHLAFEVDHDALDSVHERLRAAGVPTDGPRRLGPPGQASVYFADPFGNSLEIVADHGYDAVALPGPPDLGALPPYRF